MRIYSRVQSKQRGVALFYAVFGAFVAASMVAVMLAMGRWTNDLSSTKRDSMQAQYMAEGALDFARREIEVAVANFREAPVGGTVAINGVDVDYTINQIAANNVSMDPSGIQSLVDTYEIEARSTVDGAQFTAQRIISTDSTPIFQFAVFYDSDLEIQPGPSMTLSGRVHSNGDMFLGCGDTLTVDTNYLRAKGNIYRHRKINDSAVGTVEVRRWVDDPWNSSNPVEYNTMYRAAELTDLGVPSTSGYDSDFDGYDANGDGDFYDSGDWLPFVAGALEFWGEPDGFAYSGHTVQTGAHGVQTAVAPSNGSLQMFEEQAGGGYELKGNGTYGPANDGVGTHARGYFHREAGLSILVHPGGTGWTAFGEGGSELRPSDLNGAITLDSIYDAREAGSGSSSVPVVRIDMDLLPFPTNGLVYASHYGLDDGLAGVQLVNGAELDSSITVVTEGSLYVEGDYNLPWADGTQPSAAVIADAVNFLSNDWSGTKAPGELPVASETTYNVALITGNYESSSADYNGGLENLPRFHENWTGVSCNIKGSFVNLWESQYATGSWSIGGDRYKAPLRNWEYETAFNTIANLPPFTPKSVKSRNVVSW